MSNFALDIAASGMRAAEMRLTVAAGNIANMNTPGYIAVEPGEDRSAYALRVARAASGGGTAAQAASSGRPLALQYDPTSLNADENGMVAASNVDVSGEMSQLLIAKMDYKSNAAVVKTARDLHKTLLDAMR